ncbi:MAG: hypothetical protein AABW91_02150 [Nanoarchaeota archaeon]
MTDNHYHLCREVGINASYDPQIKTYNCTAICPYGHKITLTPDQTGTCYRTICEAKGLLLLSEEPEFQELLIKQHRLKNQTVLAE